MHPPAARNRSKWTDPVRRLKRLHTVAWTARRELEERQGMRGHVFLIALLTLGGLWLASAAFMHEGVNSLGLRYAMALPLAYAFYLLLLRLWARSLARHDAKSLNLDVSPLDLLDVLAPRSSPCTPDVHSGAGGDFRGGSATEGWAIDDPTPEGLAHVAEGAGDMLGNLDEGVIVAVPMAVVLGLVALLAGVLGTGVFMLFGVEVLVAVTWEVTLASVAGSLAYKGFAEGWLSSALRHTGRGFLLVWTLSVLLGAGIDHWIPTAHSLPHALQLMKPWS